MLNNAADYRYITNPQPIAAGIRGGILPVRDGTAPACIETYEDYCYLVEMARERYFWDGGYGVSAGGLMNFDPTVQTANVITLADLSYAIRNIIPGKAVMADRALIPANWSYPSSYPLIVNIADGYAYDMWRATMATAARVSPATIPYIVDADTQRKLYYDLGGMKRWMFRTYHYYDSLPSSLPWADRHIVGMVIPGGVVKGNSSTSAHDDSAQALYYGYGPSGPGSSTQYETYCYPKNGYIRCYIRSPFLVNELTGASYYSSGTAYMSFILRCYLSQDPFVVEASGIMPVPTANGTVSVQTVSGINGIDGYFDVPITIQTLKDLRQQLSSWWASQSGYYGWCDFQLDHLFFDTGVIDHVTNLPSSWTWQPSS